MASGDLTIEKNNVTGVSLGKYNSEIILYPNPVTEILSLEIPFSHNPANITIMDYMGDAIYETV